MSYVEGGCRLASKNIHPLRRRWGLLEPLTDKNRSTQPPAWIDGVDAQLRPELLVYTLPVS
jgi:hypothetical protein